MVTAGEEDERQEEREGSVCVCGCLHKPACLCSWQFYSSMKVDKWNIWEVARLWMHSWFKFLAADNVLEKWAEVWGTVELFWPQLVHKSVFRWSWGLLLSWWWRGMLACSDSWDDSSTDEWFQCDLERLSNVFIRYSWRWTHKLVLILQIQFH